MPLPVVPFSAEDIDLEAYRDLRDACGELRFLPTFRHGVLLQVAMVAPDDESAVRAIRRLSHQEVRRFGISAADFENAAGNLNASPAAPRGTPIAAANARQPVCPDAWDTSRTAREVAVGMVAYAFEAEASDLLLDDQEGWMDVALKRAGRKEMLPPVDKGFSNLLLKAFKEMAGLSTHAATAWQSGAASVPMGGGREADLRIEVSPTVHGQSLVARVQDRALQLARMQRLPFANPRHTRLADACLRQSQGLIVATGPTGQGKTTTLYACLGQLDRSLLNIRTLEDPVEFIVPWITQIPVGAGTGRTFGEGLKSLLRQAPHVILMGEIRDGSAAQTCVEAVDTGHLIFATLHTRDAIGVVARLLDLGLTGRQIGTSLLLAIGQRLAPRLCPACRRPAEASDMQRRHFDRHRLAPPAALWAAPGCPECGGRGVAGVVPIFELFHPAMDPELEETIGRASRESYREDTLRRRWQDRGGVPLASEALTRAAAGEIAYAEAARVDRQIDFQGGATCP